MYSGVNIGLYGTASQSRLVFRVIFEVMVRAVLGVVVAVVFDIVGARIGLQMVVKKVDAITVCQRGKYQANASDQ